MRPLEPFWKETKEKFDKIEKALIDCYIDFLREVARIYLEQGRRVFSERISLFPGENGILALS